MKFSDLSYNLRVELDSKDWDFSAAEIEEMERSLDQLSELVANFPKSDLYITVIHFARSKGFHVKTSLVLPGRTLFTGERADTPHPAFERCVRKLMGKVEAYKQLMSNRPEIAKQEKHTHQELEPILDPDSAELQAAIHEENYAAFRRILGVYEEPLRMRVGRWVQRYPLLQSQIDRTVSIADFVEEVFLSAFDQYEERPRGIRFGDWLDALIDPAIRLLVTHPEEMENVSFARTLTESPDLHDLSREDGQP
jgi:ribosome-associated translation inhibitor RaiA